MDVQKICLTCLSLTGPFLSIYDGGSGSCLADMLKQFTKTKPRPEDNLPKQVCLGCLSEINHCYTFKIKCENSSRTLRQLLPNALPEEPEFAAKPAVPTAEKAVQTTKPCAPTTATAEVQTTATLTTDAAQNTSLDKSASAPAPEEEDAEEDGEECQVFDYELPVEHTEKEENEEPITVYKHEPGSRKTTECNIAIFEAVKSDTEMPAPAPTPKLQMRTRKSAAKLLLQQQEVKQSPKQEIEGSATPEPEAEAQPAPAKRSSRRRPAEKPTETAEMVAPVPKLIKVSINHGEIMDLKYHCDRCNAGFALEKSLVIHRRQKGCINRNYPCNECERVFVSPEHLAEHQATHGTYNCQECGLLCDSKEQLGKHMVQGHKRNLRNQCSVCKKVFTMLSTLRDHMRIHTGEKPFLCNICGKSFTQNANLRQHKLRHSDIKSFKCSVCPHSFVTKAELTSHARTHTGVKPYECEVCMTKFTTSCSLAKHKRKHTGERPYACDLCPMRFTALNVLKNHRRTHTGERPYVCPFCSKTFTQRGDCQMHQRTHQGDKIYICPVCSEEFKSMPEMRTHLAVHEQEDKRLMHFTLLSNKENGSGGAALDDELTEVTDSALML
ncbi:zinc finger protein 629 [Drosophila obscura]|uniref:zinc finger protein 629 n=1 Tax=Drosophila obscura TaxID=7282 RepID=UPI001BB1B6A7|nr:zinc finger protein 629 [Drosophila obscura]